MILPGSALCNLTQASSQRQQQSQVQNVDRVSDPDSNRVCFES